MEKDLIFVGENGITDTKANRIADFAKLSYVELESEIEAIKFYTEKIETINGSVSKELSVGVGGATVLSLPEKIEHIGELKTLCAWLREAVQAHQNLINETKRITIEAYAKKFNITLPEEPSREKAMTNEDVIASFSIKKRNQYYALEAHAATIGKFIHKDGAIDMARKNLYKKIANPHTASVNGQDTIIYTYNQSVAKETVEEVFYALQQKHAEYQSELNAMKSEIKSRIINDEIDKNKAFNLAYDQYRAQYQKIYNDYQVWHQEEQKRVQNLKIVIPNSLTSLFEEINQLGKKSKS